MTVSPEMERWFQRAREADILEEARARGAALKKTGGEWIGPCPVCGGTDRFGINPAKGVFVCRGSVGGDVIALVAHLEGMPMMRAASTILGEPPPGREARPLSEAEQEQNRKRAAYRAAERAKQEQERESNERDNQNAAARIWSESKPIEGTPAESYLLRRGFARPSKGWPNCIRYNAAVNYPGHGKHPALICRVDNARGDATAIWRIYITVGGHKAALDNPKRGLGPASGGAVRIGGTGPHIGLAEGVESAMGAWSLIGFKFPVWAALSTSGLVGFSVPEGVQRVTIFPDGDLAMRRRGKLYEPSQPPGRAAALKLQARLHSQSIPCVIAAEPAAGLDYADLWVELQKESAS